MRPIALVFEAADDRPLAATVLEPSRVEGAVVIASATGVPRRIYEGVAGCDDAVALKRLEIFWIIVTE